MERECQHETIDLEEVTLEGAAGGLKLNGTQVVPMLDTLLSDTTCSRSPEVLVDLAVGRCADCGQSVRWDPSYVEWWRGTLPRHSDGTLTTMVPPGLHGMQERLRSLEDHLSKVLALALAGELGRLWWSPSRGGGLQW